MEKTPESVAAALAAPFPAECLGWKPQIVKGARALAMPYIDARDVQARLDEAAGAFNWRDEYTPLPDGSVICTLSLRVGGEWVSKSDIGGQSDQPDGGDRMKAAFSDALKRAAVKWGVGRYIYAIPEQWADYDPTKKQVTPPQLPAKFLPAKTGPAPKPAAAAPAAPPPPAAPALNIKSALALAHYAKLKEAKTADELRPAWEAAYLCRQKGELNDAEFHFLEGVKDGRKSDLAKAAQTA